MHLPVYQVRKGQPRPAELLIQPDTEVVQGDLGDQARLKPAEIMRTFSVAAEGMRALFIHRLHDLAHPRPPASEPLGPRRPAIALGRADALGAIGPPPGHLIDVPLETLVDDGWPTGRGTRARQARVRIATQGKERLREGLIFGACRPKAETGDPLRGIDRQEQMAALIPAQPVAPANSGQAWQSARAAALGIPRGDAGAVQGFVRASLGRQHLHEVQKTGHQRRILLGWASRSGGAPRTRRCQAASAVPPIWRVRATKERCARCWTACCPWRPCLRRRPLCCRIARSARLC
jgi:hypothetical protein